ncbi:MAG: hypothetical protein ABSB19_02985 [Methylomonas sp.]
MIFRRITNLIVFALTLGFSARGLAAELYIIANPALTVEASAVKSIFLGETQFSGSVKLEPTDNAAAQEVFLAKVMSMDKAKYDAVWVKKSFRDGVNQPPARGSDAEVIDFVKKTPGAIGYVITAPTGIKVIQQF